jgi:hypothetical protein
MRTIRLLGGEEDGTGTFDCVHLDEACEIVFRYRGKVVEESARDYFEAFCRVLLRLEREKLSPLCHGASLNVYPSSMGRDMGAGLMAYRTAIWKSS